MPIKHIEEIFGCMLLVVFVGLTIVNVILRYCFNFILPWAEEVILIAFIWSIFLGSVTAFRNNRHVAIDALFNLFPAPVKKILGLGLEVLVLCLNLYMTYLGIVLCMNAGVKSTFVLRLSYVYIDAAVVVSFGGMSFFGIIKLIYRIAGAGKKTAVYGSGVNEGPPGEKGEYRD
jgi:TRAP-type C4-dicarboxylate transport system permease small subunit